MPGRSAQKRPSPCRLSRSTRCCGVGLIDNWSSLAAADAWTLRQFHDFGANRPGWIGFWRAVSDVLSPTVLRAVALLGIIAALICRQVRVAVFLAVTVILLVGLSRVVLNVHPSDVVAAWALGLLYYLVCVAVVRLPVRRQGSDLVSLD